MIILIEVAETSLVLFYMFGKERALILTVGLTLFLSNRVIIMTKKELVKKAIKKCMNEYKNLLKKLSEN